MTQDQNPTPCSCACLAATGSRRSFIGHAVAAFAAAQVMLRGTPALSAEDAVRNSPPQPGDFLTYQSKSKRGPHLAVDDLKLGAKQIIALPVDPATGIPRDGSRLNQVMLTRLDSAELDETTLARAAEGVVAYSTACTHDGCPVTSWDPKTMQYVCPCHQSRFDPKAGGVLISGPAYRPLPALPLKVEGGVLVVADVLTARPGGGR
jgi:rieske iron-sulfur protein